MTWHATLGIDYTQPQQRTLAQHRHCGPLRLLKSLYPEGDAVCHNVLVHPPGGLVGGDTLDVTVNASGRAHGLITTPGATRFYRSAADMARQRTTLNLTDQARLEWLPLETLAYNQCQAENCLTLNLAPQAECMGWDVTALGLPEAGLPFEQGRLLQHIDLPGVWLERGWVDATDHWLMDGPVGLAGMRCMATLWFASGSPLAKQRIETGLELARQHLAGQPLSTRAGATSPHPQVLVLRVLTPLVEPTWQLLRPVWAAWRAHFWQRPAANPRIWAT